MGQCYRIARSDAGGGTDGQTSAATATAAEGGASAAPPSGDGARRKIKSFSHRQLKTATNNFNWDNCVGQGLYGCMFKGTLEKTGQDVAVRMLYDSPHKERRFTADVTMLTNLRHPNLVNLIGSCAENEHRYIVYEFMPSRSLRVHLNDGIARAATLNWSRRMKVAAGVATVLNYLHNEANPPVIFKDLKSSNILLDEGFNPKLCDFADAKFANDDNASSSRPTNLDNFTGYTAPESVNNGEYTTKSDVYNFGVLMLELISGFRPTFMPHGHREPEPSDIDRAREALASEQPGEVFGFADKRLRRNFQEVSVRRALVLTLMCLLDDPEARPKMNVMMEEFNRLATEAAAHAVDDEDPVEVDDSSSDGIHGGACAGDGARRKIKSFSRRQLKIATDNFHVDNCFGQGRYGCMYKGTLENTGQDVAIRMLYECPQRERRFRADVTMLTNLCHPNLVNLIGSCAKKNHRYVVYEFMPSRSLQVHLNDGIARAATLNWSRRMKVAAGIASVLNYLHNEANPPIIFKDLKSSNVLLDEEFNPKLCDFGDAMLTTDDNASSSISRDINNITGYAAPESLDTGEYTTKSDVYNFGVLMLELITGIRPAVMTHRRRKPEPVDRAHEALASEQPGDVFGLADEWLRRNFEEGSIRRALELTLTCLEDDPEARPKMNVMMEEFNILATEAAANAVDDHHHLEMDDDSSSGGIHGGACAANVAPNRSPE